MHPSCALRRCLFLLSAFACISSVHNVPAGADRKSFEVHMPGKAPIRIMDVDPAWDGPGEATTMTSEEFEHRTTRFRNNRERDEEESTENNHYPSEKLKDFLKSYAEQLNKKKREPVRDMDEVKLYRPGDDSEDETHFSESAEDEQSHNDNVKQDKANKWDLIHVQKYQQPVLETQETNRYHGGSSHSDGPKYTDKNKVFALNVHQYNSHKDKDKDSNKQGWVTLEAVPWSISKISKWESNKKRPWHEDNYGSASSYSDRYTTNKYPSKPWPSSQSSGYYGNDDNPNAPWEHYSSTVGYRPEKPSYQQVPGYRPHSSYYSSRPGYDKDELDAYHYRPQPQLQPHPDIDYDQNLYNRPHLAPSSPFSERPYRPKPSSVIGSDYGRPYWNKLSQLHHNAQYHNDGSDCDHNNHYKVQGGIITDGLPGNFPKELANRRRGVETKEEVQQPDNTADHPDTHPANGDGEWVLLTTTKGYQRPSERQRSLKIIPAQRQVRLTVLPPDKKSNINMTTSHGGLLEVESTFETVEQAHRVYAAKQMKFNGTKIGITHTPHKPTKVQKLRSVKGGLEPTAVVAAVGAGMIPAAAIGAMLVPMSMGRKKRSIFQTTNHPFDYQVPMPRRL